MIRLSPLLKAHFTYGPDHTKGCLFLFLPQRATSRGGPSAMLGRRLGPLAPLVIERLSTAVEFPGLPILDQRNTEIATKCSRLEPRN